MPSWPPAATRAPSGLVAMAKMKSVPPAKLRMLPPLPALNALTALSPPQVMNSAFLPMKRRRVTCLPWALMVRACSPFSKSQDLDGVVGAGAGEQLAVGHPADVEDVVRVALEGLDELGVGERPDLDELVSRAGGDHQAGGDEFVVLSLLPGTLYLRLGGLKARP